ncbi:MAG: hypothetical protein WBB43_18875 [Limnoraphis sp.]
MTTVIFVHGTGGRAEEYLATFQQIEKVIGERKPNVKLVPCLWGEKHGVKLNAKGLSIPFDLKKINQVNKEEDKNILLWEALYKDPLYEIRILGFRELPDQSVLFGETPSERIESNLERLTTSAEVKTKMEAFGIGEVFDSACQTIKISDSNTFERLLDTAYEPLEEEYQAIARAIIAEAIHLCKQQRHYIPLVDDAEIRDEAVNVLYRELTQDTESKGFLSDWTKNKLLELGAVVGTPWLQRSRDSVTNAIYPFIGDILFYQAKGKKIRDFIQNQVERVEPPVVLLSHSLGGIACVDLLVEEKIPQVELLITVGSQAPFLYEIDALQNIDYGESLPEHFPEWLNIYDLRDFLSYVGNQEGIFLNRVTDVLVNNKQPFPEAHSAYWYNSATYDEIVKVLP